MVSLLSELRQLHKASAEVFQTGAPDCYRRDSFEREARMEVKKSVDIWSLGCVLSEVATWVLRSRQGLEEYRRNRIRVHERMEPPFADPGCFHDGELVLPFVVNHHGNLGDAEVRRTCDFVTIDVTRMVEDMLELEESRPVIAALRTKSLRILNQANVQSNRLVTSPIRPSSRALTPPVPSHSPYEADTHMSYGAQARQSQHYPGNGANLPFRESGRKNYDFSESESAGASYPNAPAEPHWATMTPPQADPFVQPQSEAARTQNTAKYFPDEQTVFGRTKQDTFTTGVPSRNQTFHTARPAFNGETPTGPENRAFGKRRQELDNPIYTQGPMSSSPPRFDIGLGSNMLQDKLPASSHNVTTGGGTSGPNIPVLSVKDAYKWVESHRSTKLPFQHHLEELKDRDHVSVEKSH